MNRSTLEQAVALGQKTGAAFIATADARGIPHMAVAGSVQAGPEGSVSVTEWFCPGTLDNLQDNPVVSVVLWDPGQDRGYQLIGRSEELEDIMMMDGYEENPEPIPRVERRITIRVEKILSFSRGPHTDAEE